MVFLGENKVSVKSYYILIYSIGSSQKSLMSFQDRSMMGIMVSQSKFWTKGLRCSIVTSILVEEERNLMLKFKHFEPTKLVFLQNTSLRWTWRRGMAQIFQNLLEKGRNFSSTNLGFPYLDMSLQVVLAAMPLSYQGRDSSLSYMTS